MEEGNSAQIKSSIKYINQFDWYNSNRIQEYLILKLSHAVDFFLGLWHFPSVRFQVISDSS